MLSNLFRRLESTDANGIENMYEYKMNEENEETEIAREVTESYRQGVLDPFREAAKVERGAKKRFKKTKS
jgi:hypothetical protein